MVVLEALASAAISLTATGIQRWWERRSQPPPAGSTVHVHFDGQPYAATAPYTSVGLNSGYPGTSYAPGQAGYQVIPATSQHEYGLLEAHFFVTEEVEHYARAPHLLAVVVKDDSTGYAECFQAWVDKLWQIELPPGRFHLAAFMFSPASDSLETAPIYAAGLTTDRVGHMGQVDLNQHPLEELVDERPFQVSGRDFHAHTDFLLFSRAEEPSIPITLDLA